MADDSQRQMQKDILCSETAAYEVLYMLLSSDDEEAAKFINGIVPADLREAAENAASNADTAVLATA